jgi:Relaxase/Mobilisation nuclease domain/Large polyvalent protein-associated domain 7
MISKKVGMKTPEKSRFGKLVAYLLDPQGKKTRVGEVTITNCVSTDTTWAVREIAATQRLNARAKSDRTYHLLISLRAGENPDAKTLRVIEERFCKELGYAEHQRVSVIHHDTDNVHIHVAINKIHPKTLTLHDPVRDYKKRSKLCAILEHELGLAQDNHQRGQTRGNDVTPKSGQESFQAWLQRHAQGFIDATSWEEFHGIADAHGVRLELRANGFVFTHRRSLVRVKASSIDRRLGKAALEARLGTFIPAEYQQGREEQGYEKRPRFGRIDTSRLWEEYQAQRELHKTLRQAKVAGLAVNRAQQIEAVKAAARAKRAVIKMTLKGAGRRIAYAAVQSELRQEIRAVNARIREERRALTSDTRQLSWVDWLQQQASSGRNDALDALRVARGRDQANTISAPRTAAAPSLDPQAQITKQGTVIQKVGEHEIRDTGIGLNVEPNVGDDVLVELLGRAAERYEGGLTAYGPPDFQLRIARVAGANHVAVSFTDAELEKARQAAQAAAPAPVNKSALEYITERNSKRDRVPDIPFHRLWRPEDAGELTFVGLRIVAQQNLLIASNGTENLVLAITPEQRQHLAQHQRGIPLTISSAVTIHTHVQGMER